MAFRANMAYFVLPEAIWAAEAALAGNEFCNVWARGLYCAAIVEEFVDVCAASAVLGGGVEF